MNELQVLIVFVNLLIIYAIWNHGIKKAIVANYRHKLFMLRSELFLYAAKRPDMFKNKHYRILREYINESIRLTEYMSIEYLNYFIKNKEKLPPIPETGGIKSILNAIEDIEFKGIFEKTMKEVDDIFLRLILDKSLKMYLLFLCVYVGNRINSIVLNRNAKRKPRVEIVRDTVKKDIPNVEAVIEFRLESDRMIFAGV